MARAEGHQSGLRAYLNDYSFSPVILNGAKPALSAFILSFVEVVEWEESIRKSLRVLVKEAADLFCIGMYILSDSVLLNLTVCQIVQA